MGTVHNSNLSAIAAAEPPASRTASVWPAQNRAQGRVMEAAVRTPETIAVLPSTRENTNEYKTQKRNKLWKR